MAYGLGFAALVAILQGVAWLGPRRGHPRTLLGALLACAGLLLLATALLIALVPGFFGD